ncbi:hypothetical protein LSTR_LSTR006543 [Laodelphax striatellus]|uniref:Odorant receptor n=1 Tax=Laodelphax striatellus TaxID=195883 RepID=A0A482WGG0_LAOST|nr:hypothetical protein LSTR_LSTR006543 [Laodelphax striatellus]
MNSEVPVIDNLKEIKDEIFKSYQFLQYYPPQSITLRGYLLFVFGLCHIVQPPIAMFLNWSNWDFNSRVTAINDLIINIGVLFLQSDIMCIPHATKSLLDLICSEFTVYRVQLENTKHDIYEKKCKLVNEMTQEGYRLLKSCGRNVRYFFSVYAIVPFCGIILYFLELKHVEKLPVNFKFYSPLSLSLTIKSFPEYLVCSALQLFYMYYAFALASSISLSLLLATFHMRVEMKLFQLNAVEMSMNCENRTSQINKDESHDFKDVHYENELRLMIKQLARHHQIIYRKMKWLNDGFKARLFYYNAYTCFQICLGLFMVLKGEILLKIKYFLIVTSISATQFFLCENGQKVEDEGEGMRSVLYECDWRNKPKWFISSLQLIMMRSNRLPRISLFNLLALNRTETVVVMKGSYSYLNFLNNFSN